MELFGFQIRPVPGPEIVDFWGLNGPKRAQNPFKVVGCEAPQPFTWVLSRSRALETPEIDNFRPRNRTDLQTKRSQFPDLPKAYMRLVGLIFRGN